MDTVIGLEHFLGRGVRRFRRTRARDVVAVRTIPVPPTTSSRISCILRYLLLCAALGIPMAALILLATILSAHAVQVGYGDPGGDVDKYIAKYQAWADQGVPVEIHGSCASACAYALRWENACVAPDAVVGYHQGSFKDNWGRYMGPSDEATQFQYQSMPPGYRSIDLPEGNTGDLVWLRYRDFPASYRCNGWKQMLEAKRAKPAKPRKDRRVRAIQPPPWWW